VTVVALRGGGGLGAAEAGGGVADFEIGEWQKMSTPITAYKRRENNSHFE